MTVYSTDLTQLTTTIRETLVQRVAPGVTEDAARLELAAVVEQLDNLVERIAWDGPRLAETCARTDELAARLGLRDRPDPEGVDRLRERRRKVAALLRDLYAGGDPADVVDAVADFTDADVQEQISTALRAGLSD
ncbi:MULTISPECIES: hypothetical protein [unclassified Rhodococcus (in: high G+C Gram-positive bacteria)]|uniref:hypothetical protein n=1 Tax=unclassified Rhodococcus (in: high G+C Gram-positive bacteria) TaxID=192944 RepID=UPI00163B5268|nr:MULTISPECIES: hypothetical protein [unclassified Rhodococcus (in: high G+C Gram-positive bacteria)]MBC2637689.1 hypothetical protein [Rhodococcus sp. 3A]MBC2897567.1 hypothetical protein [Rhodococcus sp. 4CII]